MGQVAYQIAAMGSPPCGDVVADERMWLQLMTVTQHGAEPVWSNCVVTGSAAVAAHLEATHPGRLRMQRPPRHEHDGPTTLRHDRVRTNLVMIDDTALPVDLSLSPDPYGQVVVVWVVDGSIESQCGSVSSAAGPGAVLMPAHPHLPHDAKLRRLHTVSIFLSPSLFSTVENGASETRGAPCFASLRPGDDSAVGQWKSTVRFVRCALGDETTATPLVVGTAARLLAAVTAAVFPVQEARSRPHDRNDVRPVLLRRAIEYIEGNVARNISTADISAAIAVTPRAVQYMFQREFGMTPGDYVRTCRLHYAHQDLVTARPGSATVMAIAARWGFAHAGRFAVAYRRTYGRSPHATLRSP